MKKLFVNDQGSCAVCLQCEVVCSETYYKEYDPDKSCIRIVDKGDKTRVTICPQCGKCAKACEVEAIKQNKLGVYMIDKKVCTNCGKCVEACPFHVMVKVEERPAPSKCIACGMCARQCPMGILEIKQD